jgi:hypothetical protein
MILNAALGFRLIPKMLNVARKTLSAADILIMHSSFARFGFQLLAGGKAVFRRSGDTVDSARCFNQAG